MSEAGAGLVVGIIVGCAFSFFYGTFKDQAGTFVLMQCEDEAKTVCRAQVRTNSLEECRGARILSGSGDKQVPFCVKEEMFR